MLAIRSDAGDIAGQRVVAKAVGDAFGALDIAVLKWASEFVIDGGMSNFRRGVARHLLSTERLHLAFDRSA
jgi:hypothetical protein